MRKYLLLFMLLLPMVVSAQTKFGYFNYNKVFQQHPQYAELKAEYDTLVCRCEKELMHNENELTRAYVSFLDGQRDFPEPILRKRQKELQELVDKSVKFRIELKRWLSQVKDSLFVAITNNVNEAIERVCLYNNLSYAIDLEKNCYAFINPLFGVDIDSALIAVMNGLEVPLLVPATEASEEALEKVVSLDPPVIEDIENVEHTEVATDATTATGTVNATDATNTLPKNNVVECDEKCEEDSISPIE